MLKIAALTATKGRHACIERNLTMFLNQDYPNKVHIIYNNHCQPLRLSHKVSSEEVKLINNCLDYKTGKPYETLGAIYRDMLTHIPEDTDVICFMDDDDLFYLDHLSEGIKGLEKGGKMGYKPQKSYIKQGDVIQPIENVLEPSIFVKKEHLLKYGFKETTVDQHMGWLQPLINENQIFVDPEGKPTLVYTWGEIIPVFKTSGDPYNPNNFNNYAAFSTDNGDGTISPITLDQLNYYFLNQLK